MAFQHLVHPTEFSAVSNNALVFGAEIARRTGGTIHLVHVYDRPFHTVARSGTIVPEIDATLVREIRERIQKDVEKLAEQPFLSGLKLTRKLHADIAPWQFVEKIDTAKADLVVMGTRGQTGLLHGGLVGTNAERAIRYSPVPVLVVPDRTAFTGIKRILFATDFSYPVKEHIDQVIEFAKLFNAELVVTVLISPDNFITTAFAQKQFTALSRLVSYPKVRYEAHNVDDIETGIATLIKTTKSDLLAMYTHGRTGIARLLQGSIVEDLSTQLDTPILALKTAPKATKAAAPKAKPAAKKK